MKPYVRRAKDLINSNNLIDYITGIRILSCMLYDGGHDELDQFGEAYQGTLAETLWNEACLDPDNLYNNYTPLFDEKKEGGDFDFNGDGGAYDTQTVKVPNVPKTADKYFLTIRFIYDLISII